MKAILTGNCGPNAFRVFDEVGVEVILGINGLVKDVVKQYKEGKLKPASSPNVSSHSGLKGNKNYCRKGNKGMF